VTGLLQLGHDVHVFARTPPRDAPVHADVARYRLHERTHYWWSSLGSTRETLPRVARLLREGRGGATLLRSLNPLKYGPHALSARWFSQSAALLAEPPFDVVLAQFGTNGRIALTLRDLGAFDAPIATTWLDYDLSRILRQKSPTFYRELLARGDLQLPLSRHFRQRLLGLGCAPEKITVHPVGVDVARFAYAARTLAAHERVKIITVCRLVEKKGIEYGLQALAGLCARGLSFEYHLVGDGPLRARLEQRVLELKLSSQVTLHGLRTRDEVTGLLAQAHVFLSPSVTASDGDEEGVPTAIKEAMAAGLPVVSTRHAAIPELIHHGESGLLSDERDVEALTNNLASLLTQPESWPRMAQAARREIETEYDLHVLNRRLSERLGKLAADYRAASAQRRRSA
jgi:colanic acid/amylovoran biosynthesis glycosyltransferase